MKTGRVVWLRRCCAAWRAYVHTEKGRRDAADYLRALLIMAAVMAVMYLVLWWYNAR